MRMVASIEQILGQHVKRRGDVVWSWCLPMIHEDYERTRSTSLFNSCPWTTVELRGISESLAEFSVLSCKWRGPVSFERTCEVLADFFGDFRLQNEESKRACEGCRLNEWGVGISKHAQGNKRNLMG